MQIKHLIIIFHVYNTTTLGDTNNPKFYDSRDTSLSKDKRLSYNRGFSLDDIRKI
ncbi:MAG: hypothetical protein ACTHLL_03510 [Candidatus Nitrosocosmicus sp.]